MKPCNLPGIPSFPFCLLGALRLGTQPLHLKTPRRGEPDCFLHSTAAPAEPPASGQDQLPTRGSESSGMSQLVQQHTEQKSLPVGPGQPQNHERQHVVAVVVFKPLSLEATDNRNNVYPGKCPLGQESSGRCYIAVPLALV